MEEQHNGFLPFPKTFATQAIHAAQDPDNWQSSPMVLPLVTATQFKQHQPEFKDFYYGRCGNPTRDTLEKVMATLDNAKYGLVYSSGLGAINTLMGMFKSGDHVVSVDNLYGGTDCLFREVSSNFGIEVTFVDCSNPINIEKVIKPQTKMIFIETPTNPRMTIVDIGAVAKIARKHNILFVVDNTFLTPYLQRPLELGADVALYSASKYINGHADVIMGCLTTNNEKVYEKLKFLQMYMGAVPSPFDCYLVNRSLKTLALRMQQHLKSGLDVARFLEKHPKIEKVLHPGLSSHPQHQLAKTQSCGHSGTFSFYIRGDLKTSTKLVKAVRLFSLSGSLGGIDSLIEIPSTMSHAPMPAEHKAKTGVTDNLIRISVGLEYAQDIISDLDQALSKI